MNTIPFESMLETVELGNNYFSGKPIPEFEYTDVKSKCDFAFVPGIYSIPKSLLYKARPAHMCSTLMSPSQIYAYLRKHMFWYKEECFTMNDIPNRYTPYGIIVPDKETSKAIELSVGALWILKADQTFSPQRVEFIEKLQSLCMCVQVQGKNVSPFKEIGYCHQVHGSKYSALFWKNSKMFNMLFHARTGNVIGCAGSYGRYFSIETDNPDRMNFESLSGAFIVWVANIDNRLFFFNKLGCVNRHMLAVDNVEETFFSIALAEPYWRKRCFQTGAQRAKCELIKTFIPRSITVIAMNGLGVTALHMTPPRLEIIDRTLIIRSSYISILYESQISHLPIMRTHPVTKTLIKVKDRTVVNRVNLAKNRLGMLADRKYKYLECCRFRVHDWLRPGDDVNVFMLAELQKTCEQNYPTTELKSIYAAICTARTIIEATLCFPESTVYPPHERENNADFRSLINAMREFVGPDRILSLNNYEEKLNHFSQREYIYLLDQAYKEIPYAVAVVARFATRLLQQFSPCPCRKSNLSTSLNWPFSVWEYSNLFESFVRTANVTCYRRLRDVNVRRLIPLANEFHLDLKAYPRKRPPCELVPRGFPYINADVGYQVWIRDGCKVLGKPAKDEDYRLVETDVSGRFSVLDEYYPDDKSRHALIAANQRSLADPSKPYEFDKNMVVIYNEMSPESSVDDSAIAAEHVSVCSFCTVPGQKCPQPYAWNALSVFDKYFDFPEQQRVEDRSVPRWVSSKKDPYEKYLDFDADMIFDDLQARVKVSDYDYLPYRMPTSVTDRPRLNSFVYKSYTDDDLKRTQIISNATLLKELHVTPILNTSLTQHNVHRLTLKKESLNYRMHLLRRTGDPILKYLCEDVTDLVPSMVPFYQRAILYLFCGFEYNRRYLEVLSWVFFGKYFRSYRLLIYAATLPSVPIDDAEPIANLWLKERAKPHMNRMKELLQSIPELVPLEPKLKYKPFDLTWEPYYRYLDCLESPEVTEFQFKSISVYFRVPKELPIKASMHRHNLLALCILFFNKSPMYHTWRKQLADVFGTHVSIRRYLHQVGIINTEDAPYSKVIRYWSKIRALAEKYFQQRRMVPASCIDYELKPLDIYHHF